MIFIYTLCFLLLVLINIHAYLDQDHWTAARFVVLFILSLVPVVNVLALIGLIFYLKHKERDRER